MFKMSIKWSIIYILILTLPISKTYLILNNSISDALNNAESVIDPVDSEIVSLENNSNMLDNKDMNAIANNNDVWAEEEQFTETFFDKFSPSYVTERSVQNDSKKIASDYNIQPIKSALETNFEDTNKLIKRELRDRKLKSNFETDKSTRRSISTSSVRSVSWEPWTPWSSCSVSCGKGRYIRWRHCRDNCEEAETEMEEKACQMPACPQKLFGLIKL